MSFRFHTLILNQVLTGSGSVTFKLPMKLSGLIIIAAVKPLHIQVSNGTSIIVEPGLVVLGSRIVCTNIKNEIQLIHVAMFYYDSASRLGFEQPYICDNRLSDRLKPLFSMSISSMKDVEALELFFQSNLSELAQVEAANKCEAHNKGKIDSRLIKVNRYIRRNYNSPLSLDLLASLINCNPVYLSNTYSKIFGFSIMQYVQSYRMMKAQELLCHTDAPISEIAIRLGYYTTSQFGYIFKRHFQVTPGEYRKRHLMHNRQTIPPTFSD